MKCLELWVKVFALCHRPWLKHGDRVKNILLPNIKQCALAVPQTPIGKALISALAPSLGLSWWWESEEQVTAQREILSFRNAAGGSNKISLSTEPCLPGLQCQIRAREGVFGLGILSQSCLDDCQCVRIRGDSLWYWLASLHSLPLSHVRWHWELWVVYYHSSSPTPEPAKSCCHWDPCWRHTSALCSLCMG